jgi:hypothetical protein
MRRALFAAANVVGGIVLVLLFLDPTRNLAPRFALLAVASCWHGCCRGSFGDELSRARTKEGSGDE